MNLSDTLNAPATYTTNYKLLHLFILTSVSHHSLYTASHLYHSTSLSSPSPPSFVLFIFVSPLWKQTIMAKQRSKQSSLILWAAFAALLSQNLVVPVVSSASFEEQKNYFLPDPHVGSPPTGSSTPPSHATPSHGSSSHGSKPPTNCGKPPSGGHHHNPTPASPSGGHSGGYYPHPPSTPTPTHSTPSTPTIVTPPTTPIIDPGTPSSPATPTPSPPFTCVYWRTHPGLIWGLFGWWGTVGSAFGVASAPGLGPNMNLLQALSNQHIDGFGQLYREGTASLLNSMVSKRFAYSTTQVKNNFATALSSDKAAAAQAQLFKLANEGRLKPRA